MQNQLTEREKDLLFASKVGDVLFIDGDLINVTINEYAAGGNVGGQVMDCDQFAKCRNKATQLLPHPIMTYVASCDRCANIIFM